MVGWHARGWEAGWEAKMETRWEQVDVGDKAMHGFTCAPLHHGPHPAVVVLQEVFGVNRHIRAVAERIAREGYVTVAPDLFHRQGDRLEAGYDDLASGIER